MAASGSAISSAASSARSSLSTGTCGRCPCRSPCSWLSSCSISHAMDVSEIATSGLRPSANHTAQKDDDMTDDFAWMDATAQAELVRAGEVTPAELVKAAIARIEKLNPQLNAIIHRLDDKATAAAVDPALPDGPFRGVPFLVKDGVCHTAGDPFHCGMQVLKDVDWHEDRDT